MPRVAVSGTATFLAGTAYLIDKAIREALSESPANVTGLKADDDPGPPRQRHTGLTPGDPFTQAKSLAHIG
jgi:hypothetical protein